jgi:hypothetical protein
MFYKITSQITARMPALTVGRPLLPGRFLLLFSGAIKRLEGLSKLKTPVTNELKIREINKNEGK